MMSKTKISILGAGNVAVGTVSSLITELEDHVEIVICNPNTPAKAEGYANEFKVRETIFQRSVDITGTGDIEKIAGSSIVIMTLGRPRVPGMSRDKLFINNSQLACHYARQVSRIAPYAILINASNPVDKITYITQIEGKFDYHKIIGIGGTLDNGRFATNIADETGIDPRYIYSRVLGLHGPDMIPIVSEATIGPEMTKLSNFLNEDQIALIRQKTTKGGSYANETIGGTSFAVGAAITLMVKSIVNDENALLQCSVAAVGEPYDIQPFLVGEGHSAQEKVPFIGLPVRLGGNGITRICPLTLAPDERRRLCESAAKVSMALKELHDADGRLMKQYSGEDVFNH